MQHYTAISWPFVLLQHQGHLRAGQAADIRPFQAATGLKEKKVFRMRIQG